MKRPNTLASWIDAEAVAGAVRELTPDSASLAEEFAALTEPEPSAAVKLGDFLTASSEGDIQSVAAPPPAVESGRLRQTLEEVKRRLNTCGMLRQTEATTATAATGASKQDQESLLTRRGIPYFTPPLGPMGTRIRALMDYLQKHVPADAIFILDSHGCPVSDNEPSPQLMATAISMSEAARRAALHMPTTADGILHMDLAQEGKLCVIHTETKYGQFCLGVVSPEVLSATTGDRLRRALKRTVETDGKSPTGPVRVERW